MPLSYNPALDGLRGASVILVVGLHAEWWGFNGAFGVDIFFVLSGFLITSILLREYRQRRNISLPYFYKRRALKLFPPLYVMLAVFAVYLLLFDPPAVRERVSELLETAFYVHNWTRAFEAGTSLYLGHTWSLGIELQFYLLWSILMVILLRLSASEWPVFWAAVLLASASAVWKLWLTLGTDASLMRVSNDFTTRVDSVLIGCALVFVVAYISRWWPVGIAGLAVLFVFNTWTMPTWGLTSAAVDLFAALVVAGAVDRSTLLSRALATEPLIGIGKISYGLYVYHYPIITALAVLMPGESWAVTFIGLPLMLVIAIVSYRYMERPLLARR